MNEIVGVARVELGASYRDSSHLKKTERKRVLSDLNALSAFKKALKKPSFVIKRINIVYKTHFLVRARDTFFDYT